MEYKTEHTDKQSNLLRSINMAALEYRDSSPKDDATLRQIESKIRLMVDQLLKEVANG